MVNLVGFSGYARTGKDSAAQVLRGEGFQRVAFADILRKFLLALDPIVHRGNHDFTRLSHVIQDYGWDGYKETAWALEIRALLQRLGTEGGRELLGASVWIDATLNSLDPDQRYAITDVRFPNEADAIREKGGIVIRLERPGITAANGHSSETAMDDYHFDAVVHNDDSHEVLRQRLMGIIHKF